jgi:hypothetical protein
MPGFLGDNATADDVKQRKLAIMRALLVSAVLSIHVFSSATSAEAAATVSGFAVTPSTTQAGGHPNLSVTVAFSEPTALSSLALHLPANLTADARAIPFCSRKSLLADFCSTGSRVGSITVVAVAYGIELPVKREIYNTRPGPTVRLLLGVPIVASYGGTGVAAELPVTERPQDKGLDIAITGLPSEVAGIPIRLKSASLWIKGVSRTRTGKRIRKRPFLTNPALCTPARSGLDVTLHDTAATMLTASSSFTPTGCRPTGP